VHDESVCRRASDWESSQRQSQVPLSCPVVRQIAVRVSLPPSSVISTTAENTLWAVRIHFPATDGIRRSILAGAPIPFTRSCQVDRVRRVRVLRFPPADKRRHRYVWRVPVHAQGPLPTAGGDSGPQPGRRRATSRRPAPRPDCSAGPTRSRSFGSRRLVRCCIAWGGV
jgi:hypothetical protein